MNVVDLAITQAQTGAGSGYAVAFVAGLATSVGPCVAPRYAALTAIGSSVNAGRLSRFFAFAAGTVTTYLAISLIGSVLVRLAQASSLIYWVVALALIISGVAGLCRSSDHYCADRKPLVSGAGAAFLFGAATSTAISPCCTPILVALGALSAATVGTARVALLVVMFTIGHILPMILTFIAASTLKDVIASYREATATIGAAVTIALGFYYAMLA